MAKLSIIIIGVVAIVLLITQQHNISFAILVQKNTSKNFILNPTTPTKCNNSNIINGDCIYFRECAAFKHLLMSESHKDRKYFRHLICESHPVQKICCPSQTNTALDTLAVIKLKNNIHCITQNIKSGKCINLQDCPSMHYLLKSSDRRDIDYLRSIRCNPKSSTNTFKICCPIQRTPKENNNELFKETEQTESVNFSTLNVRQCTIPNISMGICVNFRQCPFFNYLLHSNDLKDLNYFKTLMCPNNNNHQFPLSTSSLEICCPIMSSSIITPEITTKTSLINTADDTSCFSNSECLEFKNCSSINHLDLTIPKNVKYLKTILCKRNNFIGFCCPYSKDNNNNHTITSSPSPQRVFDVLPNPPECGQQNVVQRIAFGKLVSSREFPWLVKILYNISERHNNSQLCGGSLINSRFVLSAAHCLREDDILKIVAFIQFAISCMNEYSKKVRLGHRNCKGVSCNGIYQFHIDIDIDKIIIHENYSDDSTEFDISLIRLTQVIHFTEYIHPICLPKSTEHKLSYFLGDELKVAGWGLTETDQISDQLLKGTVRTLHNRICKSKEKWGTFIEPNQICAHNSKSKDPTRKGDSGSPLMYYVQSKVNNTIKDYWLCVGIMIFGDKNHRLPGVFTRVGAYMEWIEENVKL